MENLIPAADAVYMSAEAADKLLAAGNGDAALLYIFILKNHGACPPEEAARLPLSGSVEDASAALRRLGLITDGARRVRDREQPPRFNAEEIYASAKSGSGFAELVPEVESVLGKSLSPAELQAFFLAFDYLGLPSEVILLLTSYCIAEAERRQGRGRLPSARTIEATAFRWANDEIFTLEAAEERIRHAEALRTGVDRLASALGLSGRKLGKSEENYLAAWSEMGFEPETVLEAYDRTVVKTGGMKWHYMNSILKSWHEKGIRTPEDIERLDGRRSADRAADSGGGDEIENMKRLLDKLVASGEEHK